MKYGIRTDLEPADRYFMTTVLAGPIVLPLPFLLVTTLFASDGGILASLVASVLTGLVVAYFIGTVPAALFALGMIVVTRHVSRKALSLPWAILLGFVSSGGFWAAVRFPFDTTNASGFRDFPWEAVFLLGGSFGAFSGVASLIFWSYLNNGRTARTVRTAPKNESFKPRWWAFPSAMVIAPPTGFLSSWLLYRIMPIISSGAENWYAPLMHDVGTASGLVFHSYAGTVAAMLFAAIMLTVAPNIPGRVRFSLTAVVCAFFICASMGTVFAARFIWQAALAYGSVGILPALVCMVIWFWLPARRDSAILR